MNIRFLRNCVLGLCLVLSGCTTIPHAMEAYHEHGWKGIVPHDSRGDAYAVATSLEFQGDKHEDNTGNSKTINYSRAYYNYLIADYLGDIRAKNKLPSISKKLPFPSLQYKEKEFRQVTQKLSAEGKSWNEMYKVPPEFDRNLMK